MPTVQIGWAETDITPKEKIKLAGQFFERISDTVETPLSVTALAVESGGEQCVLCSCDLPKITAPLLRRVREKLADVPGLDPEKVILAATHTHTSYLYEDKNSPPRSLEILLQYMPPEMTYVPLAEGEAMDPYAAFLFLADRIAEAVRRAWESRAAGSFAGGFGRAAVGMCRRVVYDDGTAKMWGDTNRASFMELEGGNDSGIELLYCFDSAKKLTGVAVNIACPSQVVEQRSFISSDYWGKVKLLLREAFGENIFVLGLCAAAGDQCPRDLVRWVEPESPIDDPNVPAHSLSRRADPSMYDVAGTWKIGKRIVNEITDAFEEARERPVDDATLIHRTETLELPLRRVTITEAETAKEKLRDFFRYCGKSKLTYTDNAEMHVYAGTLARFAEQETQNVVPIEVHTIRLGDMALCTNPFELFLDYGNQIRARSRAKQTFIVQLACGAQGYLPTEKAERGSHYSAYVSSGYVGHEGGDLLVRTSLERINNMFE